MYHACAAVLLADDESCSVLEHGVESRHVHIGNAALFVAIQRNFRQQIGRSIALLFGDVADDVLQLVRIDEGTLYADGFGASHQQHVALAHKLVGTGAVEDGLAVHARRYLEGHSSREVCFDGAGDDVGCGALRGDYHVDADGTGQLSNAGDGEFYLLAGCHDEVAVLVDDDHNVWHVAMAVVRVELALAELLVVLLHVPCMSFLQEVVAVVHLDAKALERLYHLVHIGDDGLLHVFVAFHLCQEMVHDGSIEAELHLLRVDHHELQLSRMLLVEERCEDDVQSDRLALTRCTRHEQVRHLGEVGHKDLVRDGLAQSHRQLVVGLLELAAVQDAFHRHHLRLCVRHLDADGSFAGDGSDDADAESAEAEGNVVFQVADGADAYAWSRRYLVERDGGTDGGFRVVQNLNTEVAQDRLDAVLVVALLLHVDGVRGGVVVLEQVEGGVLVVLEVELRVVGLQRTVIVQTGFLRLVSDDNGYVVRVCFLFSLPESQRVVAEFYCRCSLGGIVGEGLAWLSFVVFVLLLREGIFAVGHQGVLYFGLLLLVLFVGFRFIFRLFVLVFLADNLSPYPGDGFLEHVEEVEQSREDEDEQSAQSAYLLQQELQLVATYHAAPDDVRVLNQIGEEMNDVGSKGRGPCHDDHAVDEP